MLSWALSCPTFYFICKWTSNSWLQCWTQRRDYELANYSRSFRSMAQQKQCKKNPQDQSMQRPWVVLIIIQRINYKLTGIVSSCRPCSKSIWPQNNLSSLNCGRKRLLTIDFFKSVCLYSAEISKENITHAYNLIFFIVEGLFPFNLISQHLPKV